MTTEADLLAALTAERDALAARLATSEALVAALGERLALLAEAEEVAQVGSWAWSVPEDRVSWSEQLYHIYDAPLGAPMDYNAFLARVHPQDLPHVRASVERLFAGEDHVAFQHRIVRPDGSRRTLRAHAKAERDAAGAVVRMVGTGQDVTERERLQRERIEALEQTARLKDHFLGILSHELRTPLNAVMGFASVIAEGLAGPVAPQQAAYLEKILGGSEHLLALIDDLLDLTRVRAGQLLLTPEPVDLQAVARAVLARHAPAAKAKGYALVDGLPQALPTVVADAQRMGQVLDHLVGNAVKFGPPGGRVVVRADVDGDVLRCEVTDDGPGIPQEAQAALFEPFTQVDASATREFGGTGLGLSLARAFVQAHGGMIGVESRPGAGSTFWFTLPAGAPVAG